MEARQDLIGTTWFDIYYHRKHIKQAKGEKLDCSCPNATTNRATIIGIEPDGRYLMQRYNRKTRVKHSTLIAGYAEVIKVDGEYVFRDKSH